MPQNKGQYKVVFVFGNEKANIKLNGKVTAEKSSTLFCQKKKSFVKRVGI